MLENKSKAESATSAGREKTSSRAKSNTPDAERDSSPKSATRIVEPLSRPMYSCKPHSLAEGAD